MVAEPSILQSLPDTALIQRIQNGESDALLAIYERYGSRVYGVALRVLRQPELAEEVAQDVFLRVWYRSGQWEPAGGAFPAWLLTVTRNAAIDLLRKEQRHREQLVDMADGSLQVRAEPAPSDLPNWHDGQLVLGLLDQLPDEQRSLVELAFFWGYTHRELAEGLDLPLGTVKTRLRAGIRRLRALWSEADLETDPDPNPRLTKS